MMLFVYIYLLKFSEYVFVNHSLGPDMSSLPIFTSLNQSVVVL